MARTERNQKGFLTIRASLHEMMDKLGRFGTQGVCDKCMSPLTEGYYVAGIDKWLCHACYKAFVLTRFRDTKIMLKERVKFKRYMELFDIKEKEGRAYGE